MSHLINPYFSKAELDRIEQAVQEAERTTDGEIALVITRRSSRWWQDAWLTAALFGLLAAVACLAYTRESGWGAAYDYSFAAAAGVVVFFLSYLLWRLPWARTGASKAVWNRALARFHGLRPTRARTGVLLYISLEERQVAVVADAGIAAKVPPDYWDTPREMILAGFRSGKQTEGVAEAVREVGRRLSEHFPRSTDDTNELPDRPTIEE